jgi:hypothetical protein
MLRRLTVVLIVVLAVCTAGWAQTFVERQGHPDPSAVAPGREPGPSYGTASSIVAVVTALECSTYWQTHTWRPTVGTGSRYLTAAGTFECVVHMPAGASILRIELEACDTSSVGEVIANFGLLTSPGGPGFTIASVSTGVAATPDCNFFGYDLPSPLTVNNETEQYSFEITNTTYDGKTEFAGARVYYKLQVSAGPATATFSDVSTTSPYYKFVEALASAGIVAGCGGGNYCPNNPVTRGQMAVFLASALGMHYPE